MLILLYLILLRMHAYFLYCGSSMILEDFRLGLNLEAKSEEEVLVKESWCFLI